MNFSKFVEILKDAGAVAFLSLLSFSVTRIKDGEARRMRLNTQAELKDNADRIGTKDTLFTVSAPKDNESACAVARKIAESVVRHSEETFVVTEQEYKNAKQYVVGRPQNASDLASLFP